MPVDAELNELVEEAWRQHSSLDGTGFAVRPSMPILYFGDFAAFQGSASPRTITVGLNPSDAEFPKGAAFSRFPLGGSHPPRPEQCLAALNHYFYEQPYWRWFRSYEQALIGLGTSYERGALHTDIASTVATDPTWSHLDRPTKAAIEDSGVDLWHRLARYLQPDILLWSTARRWRCLIQFAPLSNWETLGVWAETEGGLPRKRPLEVQGRWYEIAGKQALVVHAPAAQTPLARFSHPQKSAVGARAREYWSSHAG